jgi:tetratricopeptide (TPR) repeat protein
MNFFISRAGEDSAVARWIAGVLEGAGHTTTIQDFDFQTGSVVEHIRRGMDAADQFLFVLSPRYLAKPYTLRELDSAIASLVPMIPVRVQECELPHPIKDMIWVEFVGADEETRRDRLLGALAPARARTGALRTFISKLPAADPNVFGRESQTGWLEQAWSGERVNFAQIVAPGGTGKTALVSRWYRGHLDDATIFGWSFYSQGTGEERQTSSDPFFTEALRWFGITVGATESVYAKVDALAARLRRERVLLILDGIEPLQDPSGGLRDTALKALLEELAARNAGLVLCTTRVRLTDVPDEAGRARSLELENLDPTDGARYLEHLGVQGEERELQDASAAYGNHALALTLLGTYLSTFCDGDIRRRTDIRELQVEETKAGRHARKVMASYARMYDGRPELEILKGLGYFDRPAEAAALRLVMREMAERPYRAALKSLKDARLVLSDGGDTIDCHPLVREHFSETATAEGHARLFEHYQEQAPGQPATIEEMTPLFHAVYHGCKAARHQEAFAVYYLRILRGPQYYLWKTLGQFGTDASLLANFFEVPWSRPAAGLTADAAARVSNQAGFTLRAQGRLADAVEPMRAGARADERAGDARNAAIAYGNLSELLLSLGNVAESVATARRAVEFARRSDAYIRMVSRATLADALHQAGQLEEAEKLFVEAERLQAEAEPGYTVLKSVAGFRYCDLLLTLGRADEVRRRASETLRVAEGRSSPLGIGLDHISLGRACEAGSAESVQHLDRAVEMLRVAGTLNHLPRALLARGTERDLEEVRRLATRCGMRLFLADDHLAMARRTGDRGGLEEAERLIAATGYRRREAEAAGLR